MSEHPSLEPVAKKEPLKIEEIQQKTEQILSVQEERRSILLEINNNLQKTVETNLELDAIEKKALELAVQYYEKMLARM